MPSHRYHEEIGALMGINMSALRDANLLIDDPDKWFSERGLQNLYGLKHDDDRVFAMNVVRSLLRDIYGDEGMLAADLHYAVDYTSTILNYTVEYRCKQDASGKQSKFLIKMQSI
ncbi:MAG: hypothetical protein QW128_02730 [Thermoprotei archaeon]